MQIFMNASIVLNFNRDVPGIPVYMRLELNATYRWGNITRPSVTSVPQHRFAVITDRHTTR